MCKKYGKMKSVFVIRPVMLTEIYLDISLDITGVEKAARKTRCCCQHRHVRVRKYGCGRRPDEF